MSALSISQHRAAVHAMHGLPPEHVAQLISYTVGVVAILWFFITVVSLWRGLQDKELNIGDVLGQMAIATFILISTGVWIMFSFS